MSPHLRLGALSRRRFLGGLLSAAVLTSTDALAIEPRWLRVQKIRITPRPSFRFVQISDIHYKGDRGYLEKVVRVINEQHPDFVCFTGDLIENAEYAPEALEILEKIETPLFGIPGNHDHWADLDFDLPRQSFAKTGGQWLMNEDVVIQNGSVHLFGMSGLKFFNFSPSAGRKNILLSHYPTGVEGYTDTRFDLIIAGHSHGGQVRIPGYGALIVPFGVNEYQLGMYQTASGPLYVNAGIGWFYANVRIFCRPEITVFEV
ncbi:MAG: metallophosphoesterase [Verrucomicrobiales bacterium]|nr:metallophosphoesterase [Verrucomicrobiales bacterium]